MGSRGGAMQGGASWSNPVRSDSGNEITRHHRQLYNNRCTTQIRIQNSTGPTQKFDHGSRRFATGLRFQSTMVLKWPMRYTSMHAPQQNGPRLRDLCITTSVGPPTPSGCGIIIALHHRWGPPGHQAPPAQSTASPHHHRWFPSGTSGSAACCSINCLTAHHRCP